MWEEIREKRLQNIETMIVFSNGAWKIEVSSVLCTSHRYGN